MIGRILLADNDPDFLATRAEFLELAGYDVIKAVTLAEAERILQDVNVHLAILDVRMEDDDDERDESGLALAGRAIYGSIPKIILTNYPSWEASRVALKPRPDGAQAAIDFLDKAKGPEALIEAVNEAFAQHVRINWDLVIDWKARDPFALVRLIEPNLEGERLLNRAEELEDLFRRLFYEKDQIRVDRLLWQREGRVALTVFTFAEGKAPESLVVVCGQNARLMDEARRYEDFAPKAPGDTGTTLSTIAETSHFAANGYTLAGADLENVHSLVDLHRSGPMKSSKTALEILYENTLAAWHQGRILEGNKSLDELYCERLGLIEARISRMAYEQRVQTLVRQIPTLGPKVDLVSGTLTIQFGDLQFTYSDPTPVIYETSDIGKPVVLEVTPGTLLGDNILTDANERTWLTDFAGAGYAPLLWNFVALEATIRFDWAETRELQWLHEMEQRLVSSVPGAFRRPDPRDLEPIVRGPVRVIQVIRRLASRTVREDSLPYHLGIMFHAAKRLAAFNPTFPLTPNELARLAHALIAAAMICDIIAQARQSVAASASPEAADLHVDKSNHEVWVGDERIPLRGQGYDLLLYLYEHANQLCTRRELIEQVLGDEKYDERDENQRARLNTAVRRLREKIEIDPERPRYLLTQPGAGYRLAPHPEE